MSKSIRLANQLFEEAKKSGEIFHRSPPQQIEYWAHIGRIMEKALPIPVLEKFILGPTREDLEDALKEVDTPKGKKKAQACIRKTSGKIISKE